MGTYGLNINLHNIGAKPKGKECQYDKVQQIVIAWG